MIVVWLVSVPAWSAPEAGEGLEAGMGAAEVEAVLGKPNGVRALSDGQIWVYSGGISLRFAGGRLVSASGVAFGEEAEEETAVRFSSEEAGAEKEAAGGSEPERKAEAEREVLPAETASTEEPGEPEGEEWETVEQLDEVEQAAHALADGEGAEGLAASGLLDGTVAEELAGESREGGLTAVLVQPAVWVVIQFLLLLVACRMTGVEGHWEGLLLIAILERLGSYWVEWLFLGALGFPSAMYADTLFSFVLMLLLVMKLTSAKSLPSALKVVVVAKVAAMVLGYVVILLVLSQLSVG